MRVQEELRIPSFSLSVGDYWEYRKSLEYPCLPLWEFKKSLEYSTHWRALCIEYLPLFSLPVWKFAKSLEYPTLCLASLYESTERA